jgi:hypothetical protein
MSTRRATHATDRSLHGRSCGRGMRAAARPISQGVDLRGAGERSA